MRSTSLGLCAGVGIVALAGLRLSAQSAIVDRPDLQGVWEFTTITPLERPPEFADKPFLTPEEAKEYEARRFAALDLDGPRGATLVGPSVNEFWSERAPLAVVAGRVPTSLVTDPPDGRIPALTPEGQRTLAARAEVRGRRASLADFTVSERCLRDGHPPFTPKFDKGLIEIVQTSDHIAIRHENLHDTRIVPLDGRPHVGAAIRSWVGDARGEWQENTLVVDSTNFVDLRDRFDENLHLVERFSLVDRDTLLYQFTVDDPTIYTGSWTVVMPMKRSRSRVYEDACHEGNYSLPNMLSATRSRERP